MGAGISGGATLPASDVAELPGTFRFKELVERSDPTGETGRVVGGMTAVESPDVALALVKEDTAELDRRTLVASRGREAADAGGADGLILSAKYLIKIINKRIIGSSGQ